LDDVVALLRAVDGGRASCDGEQQRFERVLAKVDERIRELTAVRSNLRRTLKRCRDGTCALLERKALRTPTDGGKRPPRRGPREVLS
jgi:hypothetical protein